MPRDEAEVFKHYFYHIVAGNGSGENALRHILAPGGWCGWCVVCGSVGSVWMVGCVDGVGCVAVLGVGCCAGWEGQ